MYFMLSEDAAEGKMVKELSFLLRKKQRSLKADMTVLDL